MEGETADNAPQNTDPQQGQLSIPTQDVGSEPPPAPPPAPSRPRVTRPAPPLAQSTNPSPTPPAPEPGDIDAEKWERFRRWEENVDAKMPEIERLRKENERAKRQMEEWQAKERQYETRLREAAEHNFGLLLEAETAAIGTAINLHPEAHEDLLTFIDQRCHTERDEAGNSTVVFRDGKVEIDLNDPEWRTKMGQHIVNRKALWIKSKLSHGGGGAGSPAYTPGRDNKIRTRDDLAAALANKDPRVTLETRHLTGIAGGRAAGGR